MLEILVSVFSNCTFSQFARIFWTELTPLLLGVNFKTAGVWKPFLKFMRFIIISNPVVGRKPYFKRFRLNILRRHNQLRMPLIVIKAQFSDAPCNEIVTPFQFFAKGNQFAQSLPSLIIAIFPSLCRSWSSEILYFDKRLNSKPNRATKCSISRVIWNIASISCIEPYLVEQRHCMSVCCAGKIQPTISIAFEIRF